ncbi:peptidylprolyl isomerase [Candidatus Woesearchaeota archaeon]|nr:peptidylprolyl isomerase [Candidatus Woesearchaeota archaeon]MBW3021380.1 peptidylprolyl isomerase [Candidatus Woesearchaeota archaeon]
MAVKEGDKVKVEYEGKFDDGTVFDSSTHGDHSHPLEFEVGAKQVIPGFEKAVIGMELNDEKEFSLEPAEAYGDINPEMVKKVPKEMLKDVPEPKPGMVLAMQAPNGMQFPAKITEIGDKEITLDLNHPLAGKKLNFKIKVVGIN